MFNENKRAIVCNLDTSHTTWANTYIRSALDNGIRVTSDCTFPVERIFIGDEIPISNINDRQKHIYFLGASSIRPSDSESQHDVDVEFSNMDWADLILLVSSSEKWKVLSKRSDLENKVLVNGFPLNINELTAMPKIAKIPNSLCFLGQTREIKNIDFEIEMIQRLKRRGFDIYHLSSNEVSHKKPLEQSGCVVIEGVESEKYWKLVSRFQFFASTSFYESLCVSGIEASALGCIPVVPDHSGFKDWCPDNLRYSPFDVKDAIDIINKNNNNHLYPIDLSWYNSKNYFLRINFLQK